MATPEQILERLPDPDIVGESEYRAVYECVSAHLDCYEDDCGFTPEGWADAALVAIEEGVSVVRHSLEVNR